MITVPQAFVDSTVSREGEAAHQWLASLPGLVEDLCQQWQLTIDGPIIQGYLALIIPVRSNASEPCVLKVSWLDSSTVDEARALSVWNGHGAVRLLASRPALGALLLERLDHRHSLNEVVIGESIEIAARLLRRLAIPAPTGFLSLSTLAQELCRTLPQRWAQYGRPLPRRWLQQACDLSAQLGPASSNLLVNYDLHYDNVLKGIREPWLAVDPKVVVGDPEFGLAQLLWCRLEDIEADGGLEHHFSALIEAAALDPALARSWTVVRCLDYYLWGVSVGLTHDPARCETILNWLI